MFTPPRNHSQDVVTVGELCSLTGLSRTAIKLRLPQLRWRRAWGTTTAYLIDLDSAIEVWPEIEGSELLGMMLDRTSERTNPNEGDI